MQVERRAIRLLDCLVEMQPILYNEKPTNIYTMERIDNLDKKILQIIMKNARIPSKDVAQECGVSRAAVHQRIQRMIDMNVITGSGYHVDPKTMGYTTCTYIGIKLERGSMYRTVVPELEKIPEVVECHFVTGKYALLVKIYCFDNDHLMEILLNTVQKIPYILATETMIALDEAIDRQVWVKDYRRTSYSDGTKKSSPSEMADD